MKLPKKPKFGWDETNGTHTILNARHMGLALDVEGNIASATSTYQRAQDICSACRVFRGDLYFQ